MEKQANIIQFLLQDHRKLLGLLDELEDLARRQPEGKDFAQVRRLARSFRENQQRHLRVETEIFIPALETLIFSIPRPALSTMAMDHLKDEHGTIGRSLYVLLREIEEDPPIPQWMDTLTKLREHLVTHMREEESLLFPGAERLLGPERLAVLAEKATLIRTNEGSARMEPSSPRSGPARPRT